MQNSVMGTKATFVMYVCMHIVSYAYVFKVTTKLCHRPKKRTYVGTGVLSKIPACKTMKTKYNVHNCRPVHPGFLKLFLSRKLVCMCVSAPKLLKLFT